MEIKPEMLDRIKAICAEYDDNWIVLPSPDNTGILILTEQDNDRYSKEFDEFEAEVIDSHEDLMAGDSNHGKQ